MREKKMRAKLEDFLQEVCEKTITNNQYPVLTSSKSGLFLQSDYFNKQVASKDNTGYKIIRRGQFTYRAMSDTGEFFPNMLECADVGIVSPAYPVFEIIKQDQIVPEYLNYYFKSNRFQNSISTFAQGSTRTSVKFGKLKKVSIELPEIKKQYQIIRTLDLLRTIINNRKKEVLELDELIRARFVEMFGDPVYSAIDSKIELSDICEKITDGEHGSVARVANGHPFLNAKHILKTGVIDWKTITYIGDEDHQRIYKRCNPEKGDILLTTTGTIGNVAIVPECEEVSMDRGITLLKINRHKVTSEFVAEMLKHPSIQMAMGANVHASAIGHLFMNKVKKLPSILPSMKKQIEFTTFVQQIDKSKATVQKALDETQLLFDSLMQQYFG